MTVGPTTAKALAALPDLPRDADGPVFREPWEAQAFAMAVMLHEKGLFTWPEWAQALSREIRRADQDTSGAADADYYALWLAALERLVADKGAATPGELTTLQAAWDRAARATPHGQPILLANDPERPGHAVT